MMKRKAILRISALLVCLMVPFVAVAEGLELAQPIQGAQIYPEGVSEEQAFYVVRYECPQFVAETQTDEAINTYYQSVCDDLRGFISSLAIEDMGMQAEPGAPINYMDIGYQITANTDTYLSVTLTNKQFLGYVESESLSANVFAREGMYAGQLITLSQVMGLEQEGDEFSTEASYASQLVYKLVWRIVEEQRASQQRDYFEALTQKDLEAVFSPETDFFIDMDDNLVFYVQVGMIASDVEGILTYPFSVAELLTAVQE